MSGKVYCKDCKYCKKVDEGYWVKLNCRCPSNIKCYECYYKKTYGFVLAPEEINKNNDCLSFKMKWWKRILKCYGLI